MMVSPLTYILKLPEEQILEYKQNLNTYYAEQALANAQISGEELTSGEVLEIMSGDYLKDSNYIELVLAKQENLFNMEFLGINLGDIASKNMNNYLLYILPILCMIVTFVSLRISSGEMKKKQEDMLKPNNDEKNLALPNEEMPMPNMAVMNTMMPIMTGYIAFIAPQGLSLYWTVNSLLQLIQIVVLKKLKSKKKDS